MKVICFFFFALNMAFSQNSALEAYFQQLDPELGVSIQLMDAEGEVLFAKNDSITVAAASTIKIPILVAFYAAAEKKVLKPKAKYKLIEADKVGGSGDLQFKKPQTTLTYDELALEMIRVSDNTAANILIDKIGFVNINRVCEFYGLPKTALRRKMMDYKAVLEGKQNTTTAADMNLLLYKLLKGQLLKEKYHKDIITKLLACEDYSTFAAKLQGIPIAHKTGTLDNMRADVGIIYGKSPLVLSVFIQNFESYLQAEAVLADIAELVYLNY